ncbi:MAG TPA: GFA family protein [Hyphomicrobiaceae bacterium]|nr:GFA family protein [Hyphomicrobiaceae bacterium]
MSSITGGCQCGAVRYRLSADPQNAHVCHCRMCQKATGNYFAALARVALSDITWTRGAPSIFRSSELVERGFCRNCGTPLTFRYVNTDRINITLGSLDDPTAVPPIRQYGVEGRMPFMGEIADLPGTKTEDDVPADVMKRLSSRQHPDYDTPDGWSPDGT